MQAPLCAIQYSTRRVCACNPGYVQAATDAGNKSQCILAPTGNYLLNESSNENGPETGYCPGNWPSPPGCHVTDSTTFINRVSGLAIHVPIAQVLDASGITDWSNASQYGWDWHYLDALIDVAVTAGKKFSIALVVGRQDGVIDGGPSYRLSLPKGFESQCNPTGDAASTCAPPFYWWSQKGDAGGHCLISYVPLPWNPNVKLFWAQAAAALATHLRTTPDAGPTYYDSLTMVDLAGPQPLRRGGPAADDGVPEHRAGRREHRPACTADPNGVVLEAGTAVNEAKLYADFQKYGYGTTWNATDLIPGFQRHREVLLGHLLRQDPLLQRRVSGH